MTSQAGSEPSSSFPSRPGDDWFFAGLTSAYPNITNSSERWFKLAWPQPCKNGAKIPGCKVFHPKHNPSGTATTTEEIHIDSAVGEDSWIMKEQVLVFQYKGRFHAVDHACPHRAYSLSWGVPFDIEDAGRTLGYGLRCRGHSYSFELSTGIGDRGDYRLGVWEVELRPCSSEAMVRRDGDGSAERFGSEQDGEEREVWVKRKHRVS